MPDSTLNIIRRLSPGGIPYLDWGGQGPVLHLAHANGFPPGTYNALVQHLTGHFRVLGMECRALWGTKDPAEFRHWRELGKDLARFLQEMNLKGIIAAGHSMGAVSSLYCAVAHPELVRALVLIDPVILPAWFAPFWAIAMRLGLHRRARLAVGARRRRVEWPSREVLLRAYRSAPVFRRWQEPFLRDYVNSGTEEDPSGGVYLRYPREWEARVFETPPPDVWWTLRRLRRLPLLVLRGEFSDTYRRDTLRLMRRLLPQGTFVEVEGADHFVPMSRPEETAALIGQFISSLPEAKRNPGQ
ncbi:MAG: alpha/beta hydrolase [Chloroflexi bacterium]|nr:alpha/beta hydrolase [Chloroflexota bacterium]